MALGHRGRGPGTQGEGAWDTGGGAPAVWRHQHWEGVLTPTGPQNTSRGEVSVSSQGIGGLGAVERGRHPGRALTHPHPGS